MTPVRPSTVPTSATLIWPGQSFGPGIGVQAATLQAIQAQLDRYNKNASLSYERALADWNMNSQIDAAYGLPVPPQPVAPKLLTMTVVYADVGGNIITDAASNATGLNYAWVEEN